LHRPPGLRACGWEPLDVLLIRAAARSLIEPGGPRVPKQLILSDRRPRLLLGGVLAALLAGGVGAFVVWFVFFSSDAPDAPTIEGAAAAVTASSAPSPSATSSGENEGTAETDGHWVVDGTVGDFADFSSSWVGFRVGEVFDNIGETEAVGRTPDVSGSLDVSGLSLEARLPSRST
jgi:hypothetical protein